MKILFVRMYFLFLILDVLNIYGQGILKGTVTDSLTLDELKGAEVILTGTNFNTISNIDGEFYISGIPAGEYILQTSCLGYIKRRILVAIKSNQIQILKIELLHDIPNGTDLGNQAKNQAEDINLQLNSNTIKNVIAGKKLQDMPEENIPIALSRLPGVSILYKPFEPVFPRIKTASPNPFVSSITTSGCPIPGDQGSRILIRGLDSKFANITIDGIRIPSASAKDKSIDLSIFPERDFKNIVLNKTITSDEDADATAGSINLITGKAPDKRMIKAEMLGNYNRFDKSANQYNFNGIYGERFFDNSLGIQVNAEAEKRIISSEYLKNSLYGISPGSIYYTNAAIDTNISYTNAVRERYMSNILFDFNTPDGGSIKFNNIFNKTSTEYFSSEAYTSTLISRERIRYNGVDTIHFSSLSIPSDHSFNDMKSEQQEFLSLIEGSNYLFGLNIDWNAAFSESKSNHPFNFTIHSIGVDPISAGYRKEYVLYSQYNPSEGYGKEKAASINVYKKYRINNEISGKVKFGGKYRINSKLYNEHLYAEFVPYYNQYIKLSDGSLVKKDFSGTRFAGLESKFSNNIFLSYFQDNPPGVRNVFDNYNITLISKDALLLWRQLNCSPYHLNYGVDINSYNFSGSFFAGYVMHQLNFGQSVKFITGLRVESEKNNYVGYYLPDFFKAEGFSYNFIFQQTDIYQYNKTTILPNFLMILKPADFLNLRLAAYKTLFRPDYNARMPKYFCVSDPTFNERYLIIGNPDLKNADVWNYEMQAQFYGSNIGQFSINAFYKDIKGMQQSTNGIQLSGYNQIDTFEINFSSLPVGYPFSKSSSFHFYSYYNSPEPTSIWGFEIEHRANFRYLPGLLKNITLNYNLTFLRSETWKFESKTIVAPTVQYIIADEIQKFSDMPEFFANVILGYDIKGFSFRISYFYQDDFPVPNNYNNYQVTENKFTKLDIAARQKIFGNISVLLNLNNITNSKEESEYWRIPGIPGQAYQAYRYGFNSDFGIGVDL